VAASNEYVAKEKGCDVELWGATDRGLEKGLEERLEERRRADSEAHAIITEHEEAIGEPNEEALRDQVDEIRHTSYVVNIGLATEEEEMRRRADEASAARGTLEDHIEELKAREKPNPDEIAKAEAALAALDPSVEQAKQRLDAAEKRREELKKKYDAAFEQLKKSVEEKRDAQEEERKPEN
jgi:chromosome segregation ATPase